MLLSILCGLCCLMLRDFGDMGRYMSLAFSLNISRDECLGHDLLWQLLGEWSNDWNEY
jgi:hypothetical protein